MPIDILFEDRSVIVCVKPAGVLSEDGGMPELLEEELKMSGRAFCVHRLDRAVGGVMVYARTARAAAALSADSEHMRKEYLTVVQGAPETQSGVFRDLLFRDSAKNKTYVVSRMRKGVREAELEYEVLAKAILDGFPISLNKIVLHTGRSHQIRCQFASRKMPVAGDVKYGSRYKDCGLVLWSYELTFRHPGTGESMTFRRCPPDALPWNKFDIEIKGKL